MGNLKRGLFNVYVALNMLLCSVLFCWCALPRETISGLVGRKTSFYGYCRLWQAPIWRGARWVIDRLYSWERNHCELVRRQEMEARRALYP